MKKYLIWIVQFFVTVMLLWYVFSIVKIREVLGNIISCDLRFVIPVVSLFLCFLMITIVNTYILFTAENEIPFGEFIRRYFTTYVLGEITPGKIGQFSISLFLKEYGINVRKGCFYVLLMKVLNVIGWFLIFIIGSIFVTRYISLDGIPFPIYLVYTVLVGFLIISWVFLGLFLSHKTKELKVSLPAFFRKHKKRIFLNLIITTTKNIISVITIYLIFLSFNVTPPFMVMFFAVSMDAVVNILPISVNGIGTREVIYSFIFPKVGILAVDAVSASLLIPTYSLVSILVMWAIYLCWRLGSNWRT